MKIEIKNIEIKKNDKILIGMILLIACVAFLLHHSLQATGTGEVIVKVNGAIVDTYDLNDDQEVSVNDGSNVFVINNGKVDMIEADCPDKLCVNQRAISKNHESIICLPNKVVITVISDAKSDVDGVVR